MVRVEGADRVWGRDGDRLESGKGGERNREFDPEGVLLIQQHVSTTVLQTHWKYHVDLTVLC